MTKKLLVFISLCMLLTLGACSVDDGYDAFAAEKMVNANVASSGTFYKGSWMVVGTGNSSSETQSYYSNTDNQDKAAETLFGNYWTSFLFFQPNRQLLDISPMPQQLFMSMAGVRDGTADEIRTYYSMSLREKGYSSTAVLYELTTPDFLFSYSKGMQQHTLQVIFGDSSEMMLDTYTKTLIVVLSVKAILVDGVTTFDSEVLLMIQSKEGA